jgi:SAM-dependent methyltransferase
MTFLTNLASERFSTALRNLEASDPAVMTMRWMLGPDLYHEWAHSVGVATHSKLRDASSPIPPIALRSIVAAAEEEVFLWSGVRDISTFMSLFYEHWKKGSSASARVFDFGCGCGRMIRFLNGAQNVIPFASDINSDHVAWCATNLEGITTKLNGANPPLPFDDGAFDLAYSLSIFTHLDEPLAAAWFEDLARVLAPGGILILTTHGYPALEIIKNSDVHKAMFRKTADEIARLAADLEAERHIYIPYEQDILDVAKAGSSYGNTFMHPTYAEFNWNKHGLSVLRHLPGGVRGWQDIFVLRKGEIQAA